MENDQIKLPIRNALLLIVGFILFIGIVGSVLKYFSEQRAKAIYDEYLKETNAYIEQNRPALEQLFTQEFTDEKCEKDSYSSYNYCISIKSEIISSLLPSTLKDWSSTMFVKKGQSYEIQFLSLSGRISGINGYDDTDKKILDLLNGKVKEIPWDDYTYEMSGKEVIIPVKDSKGTIIGGIVRRVVEDNTSTPRY